MKSLFDHLALQFSKNVTRTYSSSFSIAVNMLAPSIRPAIYSIYGFVRLADEIVDSFQGYDQEALILRFEEDVFLAISQKISLNPVLNSFQDTFHRYNLDEQHVVDFMKSMKMDLHKRSYQNREEYQAYIYGSADVVGLMCLKVFVKGDAHAYERLKTPAMHLGSAFQKVNFLRDVRDDMELLHRSYFPGIDFRKLNGEMKDAILQEIEEDFTIALQGISKLPIEARAGVYTAYIYYKKLMLKLKSVPPSKILDTRIRVHNGIKISLLAKSYLSTKFNLI